MATAYKCDRCGKLYEKPYTSRRKIEIVKDCHPNEQYIYELCDECHEKLIEFIGGNEDEL